MVSGQEAEFIILPITAILILIRDLKEDKSDSDSGPGNTLVHPGIPWRGQILPVFFPFYWSDPAEFKTVSIVGFFGFSLFFIEFIYDLCIRITF